MIRFDENTVLAPSIARRRRASLPTWTRPLGRNATTDGSVEQPSSPTAHARPPTAATVFVVPRSIPIRCISSPVAVQEERESLARLGIVVGRLEVVQEIRLVVCLADDVVQHHVAVAVLALAREDHLEGELAADRERARRFDPSRPRAQLDDVREELAIRPVLVAEPDAGQQAQVAARRNSVRQQVAGSWMIAGRRAPDTTPSTGPALGLSLTLAGDSLHHRTDDQGPRDGRIGVHLGEAAPLRLGDELPPRHAFGVAAPGEPAPVVRLRTDPHRVLVAAHRLVGARAPAPDLEIRTHLLCPVARHAAAD